MKFVEKFVILKRTLKLIIIIWNEFITCYYPLKTCTCIYNKILALRND